MDLWRAHITYIAKPWWGFGRIARVYEFTLLREGGDYVSVRAGLDELENEHPNCTIQLTRVVDEVES